MVVEYIGYNGGRGRPIDWLRWSSVGYPHLVVDSRGQGGGWRSGDTPDPGDTGEPGSRGFVTTRAVRSEGPLLLAAFRRCCSGRGSHEGDRFRCRSLGGRLRWEPGRSACPRRGKSLPTSVRGSRRRAVPIRLSPGGGDHRRGAVLRDQGLLRDLPRSGWVRVQDAFLLRRRQPRQKGDVATLFSVALMDEITPPSTVFAAFNNLAGERRIEVYEFNGHEGGGSVHFEKQVGFVREHLG